MLSPFGREIERGLLCRGAFNEPTKLAPNYGVVFNNARVEDNVERTFAIIKPDAVERNLTGRIVEKIESAGFKVVGMKKIRMSKDEAGGFYYVHKDRPFFNDLCSFMSRSAVVVLVLEAENAIVRWRELMGATDPAKADPGTIRKELGLSLSENSVHGSDSPESASFEIPYFFSQMELV
jgi:nucleoside-diphosphate kinase